MSENASHQDGGKATVYAALFANLGIAVTKFIAAAFSGSSAMLAEGIHSTVDTANEGFLLLGMSKGNKPADRDHPFGYGGEVFFWSFIVAVLIFALGAGLSIYEGVRAILHGGHEAEGVPWIPLTVLGVSLCFEGYSLSVAIREFMKGRAHRGLIRDLRDMKDPSIFVVLAEDTAACLGLVIAAAGLALSWLTHDPLYDASASIVIGVVLGITAILLAIEVKGLLIGEAAAPEMTDRIREMVQKIPEIQHINEIRSLHLGPHQVLLTLSIDFADDVLSQRIEAIVTDLDHDIRQAFSIVHSVFLEVQSRDGHRRIAEEVRDTASA
ncbi:cation diffusion facilitator family transporter [Loktanella atrilutea]|uniref:Cation diffusion facilitator family transporter n=1 Tax=Loktanella atrilutea TaxID=366533 RepID=A0A1M4ZS88_LOKAT|nr:cation diffusion facilitator family transporter [Loktanella atrilutea]SHF20785.1 cation diffusion facilitator family transporter [Loktanella atrilutea]